eukprot:gb/GEZN01000485.1/.p1 GENE.gb/GEZN01000485.1/~~gb/GEZN01000485.1/.p1  ORF type:complete len:1348 (-),score=162.84 gb/GEZN01000485.1/:279-4211(-)
MSRYRCHFITVALDLNDLHDAVANKTVDLLFLDSGVYTLYWRSHGLLAIASVIRQYSGELFQQQGGVIFRKKSKHTDLFTLQQVQAAGKTRSLTVCPVAPDSFSGWAMQQYEFFKQGIDVKHIFSKTVFSGRDSDSVSMVASEECDIGMVRTHSLREVIDTGFYTEDEFEIINPQVYPGFTLSVSTSLYNEWPLATMPHVPEVIWSKLRVPLLQMTKADAAAKQGSHAGFTDALDYDSEAVVNFQLNMMEPSTGLCMTGSERNYKAPLQPCDQCKPGTFGDGTGYCRDCDPDYYSSASGTTTCEKCPTGKATKGFGDTECVDASDILFYQPIEACEQFPQKTLVVGVTYEENLDIEYARWQPTFEGALNDHFNRYQCYFRVLMLSPSEVDNAVQSKSVDLLFCNSGQYMQYHNSHGLQALASVIKIFKGRMYPKYGGVILRNAMRLTEIESLQDLAVAGAQSKLVACVPYETSFAGWYVQWYEFFKLGIDVKQVLKIIYAGSHSQAIAMLTEEKCNVSMVATEKLEQLIGEGVYEQLADFAVIGKRTYEGFVPLVSTDLYPEWPLAALPHVPHDITSLIPIPLLAMKESSPAAVLGSHAGFTTSYDYHLVTQLRYQLAQEPNATCGPGAFRNESAPLQPCAVCPAGYVSVSGLGPCIACPVGTLSALPGGTVCLHCDFGQSNMAPGSSVCVDYEKHITLDSRTAHAVRAFACLFFLFCAYIFVLVVKFRDTKLMKASSAVFNMVLILACTVLVASTVLFTILPGPDNWICYMRWWLPCIAASTLFGTLFSKTYRLYSIFRIYETKQKIPQAIRFKDTKVAGLVLSFIGATCLVLVVLFLVATPSHVTKTVTLPGQQYQTFVQSCVITGGFVGLIFGGYTVLLLGQSYLAFRVRKLPTIFNESQFIAWLLYNSVFVGLVAIMVDFMLDFTEVTAKMVVRSTAILLGALTPVIVLYVPKIAEIYRDQENASKYSSKEHTTGANNTNSVARTAGKTGGGDFVPGLEKSSRLTAATGSHIHNNKSRKGNSYLSNNASALSGQSDVEQSNMNMDIEIQLVPDSGVAGDGDYEFAAAEMMPYELQGDGSRPFENDMKRSSIANSRHKRSIFASTPQDNPPLGIESKEFPEANGASRDESNEEPKVVVLRAPDAMIEDPNTSKLISETPKTRIHDQGTVSVKSTPLMHDRKLNKQSTPLQRSRNVAGTGPRPTSPLQKVRNVSGTESNTASPFQKVRNVAGTESNTASPFQKVRNVAGTGSKPTSPLQRVRGIFGGAAQVSPLQQSRNIDQRLLQSEGHRGSVITGGPRDAEYMEIS